MFMRVRMKWVVLWSLWAARLARQPTPAVRARGGLLRGELAPDGSHARYLGIPYATLHPEDRFQAPGPAPTWSGVFEALDDNVKCTQRFTNSMTLGREDCLVLNVYTPLQLPEPLPVMVFIHGGGFRDGSGSRFLYGPEYLVEKGVILVTFNYRLEILGFLCLGTKEAPGNAGLKDQVAALRWIKENIGAFGGNPDDVTIFGESAGAASVAYHLVSPMSKGLFNKAIMQSGSAISPWSFQFEPLETAKLFIRQLGFHTEDTTEIRHLLMTKSGDELIRTRVPRLEGDIVLSENIFVPCVERKIQGVEQFLPDLPYNLISKGQYHNVPIIIGYNNAEGYLFTAKENDTTIDKLNFYASLPRDLVIPTEDEKVETANTLKKLYMGDKKITKNTLIELSNFEGDSGITYPVLATADLFLKTNTEAVYAYRLDYDGWLNIAKMFAGFAGFPGATHADDLFYMFKPMFPTGYFLERDIVHKITYMWTNFAKFGNPTPEGSSASLPAWPAVDPADPRVLVLDKQFHTRPMWSDETLRFWNKTYTKYRRRK